MKRIKFILLVLFTPAFIFSSCSNELDVLDNYKEIPVIYGLINPNQNINYVRLEKGYLGTGNALVMAQQHDSIYYDTSQVDLQLIALKSGVDFTSYKLTPVYNIFKDQGLFTDADHILYQLVMKDQNGDTIKLISGIDYKLKFTNKVTGLIDTAITKIIEPISVQNFGTSTTFPKINLAAKDPYIIRLFASKYAKVYGMIFRFKYFEKNKTTQLITVKTLDYYLKDVVSRTITSTSDIEIPLNGQTIFQYLGANIKTDSTVSRSVKSCDFVLTAGTQEFYDYYQINKPSNTVNYIPVFSNLSVGKGVFACKINSLISDVIFNDLTLDSLYNGSYTKHIFQN